MSESRGMQDDFPNLKPQSWYENSEATDNYNCIAFAGGDMNRRWEPYFHWHPSAVLSQHLAALESLYYHEGGYVRCDNGAFESGFEKIAIYADEYDDWLHAAHQRSDGWWESKLGNDIDICHETIDCLEGPLYGTVRRFLKRPMASTHENAIEQPMKNTASRSNSRYPVSPEQALRAAMNTPLPGSAVGKKQPTKNPRRKKR